MKFVIGKIVVVAVKEGLVAVVAIAEAAEAVDGDSPKLSKFQTDLRCYSPRGRNIEKHKKVEFAN
jgi:hypothetical protein